MIFVIHNTSTIEITKHQKDDFCSLNMQLNGNSLAQKSELRGGIVKEDGE